ncbi:squalene epoxidase-domain-containing protein [Chaetomidium leptoderma]|uniref:Squalene monooxygenase n=1 Tax=Chaetomidium leptoderma TaxID=669021 RepID=A0AAN6ZVJ9_9PEZI|nr:squalene epoxidase-domain-containing protein [Chaetomidium leptoderma]
MAGAADSHAARNLERRETHHEADVVVVGAGIFGCAIAFALANQGRSVILLERWMHEPDRIVGELLQPGGVAALRKLGLEHCLENIDAIPCYGYHCLYRGEEISFAYPPVNSEGDVVVGAGKRTKESGEGMMNGHVKGAVRPEGRSFHHGRFIMQLRKACMAHPNISVFETEVTATIKGEHSDAVLGVQTRTKDPATGNKEPDCFFAQLTIIADGYASVFRKQLLGTTPVIRSKFYALELIDCPFPPANHGHVVIGDQSLALLYQIGTHETRALIDIPTNHPAASPANGGVRGYITNIVLPSLPPHVQPSVHAALADGKIPKSMPNSWLPSQKQTRHDGVILLGDAHNMRHPLTGGGMTVAFNDAVLLASLLAPAQIPSLAHHAAVRDAMAAFHWRRKSLTSIINVLAQALYSLFAADDWQLRALQRGCFRYFQRGWTDEPVAMLGGIMRRPGTLAYHFFSVAFLAIWLNILDVCGGGVMGVLRLPLALGQAVLILWKACVVFLPVFGTELR